MSFRKVTAIFRRDYFEKVEQKLQENGIHGFSISNVEGYGEYANYYSKDRLVPHVRLEIFTEEIKVDKIVETIIDAAHIGMEGDGIIAVLPVETLYRIRTRSEIKPGEI